MDIGGKSFGTENECVFRVEFCHNVVNKNRRHRSRVEERAAVDSRGGYSVLKTDF